MVAASLSFQPTLRVDAQRALFKLPEGTRENSGIQRYDVSPDDRRFIMIRDLADGASQASRQHVVLMTNVLDDVRAKLSGRP